MNIFVKFFSCKTFLFLLLIAITMDVYGSNSQLNKVINSDKKILSHINPDYFLIIEPSFFGDKLAKRFYNSKKTNYYPGKLTKIGISKYSQEKYSQKMDSWETFLEKCLQNADILSKHLEIKIIRDKNDVILHVYITLSSKADKSLRRSLHTVLFSDFLYKNLKDKLGKKFNFMIPSQDSIYAFPIGIKKEYFNYLTKKASWDYETSFYPASKEIFQFSKQGIKPIAILNID